MYLIDQTYFIKQYSIPNINDAGDALTVLEQYIDEFGRKYMKNALGREFATFDAVLDAGLFPDPPTGIDQKWIDLVNGVEYTKDGKTYKWEGLLRTEGTFKSSPITPFVYCYWLSENVTTVTALGEATIEAKNATSANSTQRLVTTWNEMLGMYQGECADANWRGDFYYHSGVPIFDYYGGREENNYVSLLTYLTDNETTYPDAGKLRMEGVKNQLGL